MKEEEWDNPTPSQAIDLACIIVDKDKAVEYFGKAVTAFHEALGDSRPYGSKADRICEQVTGLLTDEFRDIRDKLNRKFGVREFKI